MCNRVLLQQRAGKITGGQCDVHVECPGLTEADTPLVAVVSSRIGHDATVKRRVAKLTAVAVAQCRRRNGRLLIAGGTAIEPWLRRAAELFQVPVLVVDMKLGGPADIHVRSDSIGIDEALIYIADRVDAVHVRPRGTIYDALVQRSQMLQDPSTRVATESLPDKFANVLLDAGAVGWIVRQPTFKDDRSGNQVILDSDDQWLEESGEWLVHCTRGCSDPWPGQTANQHLDQLLLGGQHCDDRDPLATLRRIVRSGILIASATVTDKRYPVVCFTDRSVASVVATRRYRQHLHRWDNEPYGVAVRKSKLCRLGAKPVIYGQKSHRAALAEADQFRFQSRGQTYDWTEESEWRVPSDVNLNDLGVDDVRVFVKQKSDVDSIAKFCPWAVTVIEQRDGSEDP